MCRSCNTLQRKDREVRVEPAKIDKRWPPPAAALSDDPLPRKALISGYRGALCITPGGRSITVRALAGDRRSGALPEVDADPTQHRTVSRFLMLDRGGDLVETAGPVDCWMVYATQFLERPRFQRDGSHLSRTCRFRRRSRPWAQSLRRSRADRTRGIAPRSVQPTDMSVTYSMACKARSCHGLFSRFADNEPMRTGVPGGGTEEEVAMIADDRRPGRKNRFRAASYARQVVPNRDRDPLDCQAG